MPVYDYKCPKCGNVFDEIVPMSESLKEQACPECMTLSKRTFANQHTPIKLEGQGFTKRYIP